MLSSLLISWLENRLGVVFVRLLPYFLAILVFVLAVWFVYKTGYNKGSSYVEAKYQVAIVEERDRQAQANIKALKEARVRQLELEELLNERELTIKELTIEGSLDPNADRVAIGSDSVRRINRIR